MHEDARFGPVHFESAPANDILPNPSDPQHNINALPLAGDIITDREMRGEIVDVRLVTQVDELGAAAVRPLDMPCELVNSREDGGDQEVPAMLKSSSCFTTSKEEAIESDNIIKSLF